MGSHSSKERLLKAINHSTIDFPPFYQKFWQRGYLSTREGRWRDQFERVKRTTKLGLEDAVGYEIPRVFSTQVKIIRRKEIVPGESRPIMVQEYVTPNGTLKQIVRQTADWPHGDNVPIFTDYVVPRNRSMKYLVEDKNDLEALSCLFSTPGKEYLRKFEAQVNQVRRFAEENGLLIECGGSLGPEAPGDPEWVDGNSVFLGDALHWLCGIENSVKMAYRSPDLMHRLLDVILGWSLASIDLISRFGGCDVIVHRGWYESFWSPKLYRTFLLPRIKTEVEHVHRAGAKFCYVMSSNIMPFLDLFKELGIDILYGVDPVQGGANLAKVKQTIGDHICIWGGVNSAVTLTGGNEGVEKAVEEAVRVLAPGGGFILAAIDQLFEDTKWENFLTMIQTWRKLSGLLDAI